MLDRRREQCKYDSPDKNGSPSWKLVYFFSLDQIIRVSQEDRERSRYRCIDLEENENRKRFKYESKKSIFLTAVISVYYKPAG